MFRYLTTYILLAFVMAGYLRGIRILVPEEFQMSNTQIIVSSIGWPYSLGLIVAGWDLGPDAKKKPEVETEEEYEVPEIDVRPSKELSI